MAEIISLESILIEERKKSYDKIQEVDASLKNLILKVISSIALIVSTSIVASVIPGEMLWGPTTGFVSLITTQFIYMCLSYFICLLRIRKTCVAELMYYNEKISEFLSFKIPLRYGKEIDYNVKYKNKWNYFYFFVALLIISAFGLLVYFTTIYMYWPEIYKYAFIVVIFIEVCIFIYLIYIYSNTKVEEIYMHIKNNEIKINKSIDKKIYKKIIDSNTYIKEDLDYKF